MRSLRVARLPQTTVMKPESKRGRQTVLTASRQQRICALLGEGVTIATAASLSGISERTYHGWVTRGDAGEEPYATFFDAATRARGSWKARLIARIEKTNDWRAAAFLLERSFPDEYGSKRVVEDEGAEPSVVYVNAAPSVETSFKWHELPLPLNQAQLEYIGRLKEGHE